MTTPLNSVSPDSPALSHTTVLLPEAIAALGPLKDDGVYIDGTFGRGGHSRLLLGFGRLD